MIQSIPSGSRDLATDHVGPSSADQASSPLATEAMRCRLSSFMIRDRRRGEHMAKFAIVATIKTAPGKRNEYLTHLKAHAQRCLATEPGTLKFEILVPQKEDDTI